MKKDLVIGIVGTVILVTAMIGVFRYEASRGGGSSFEVTWSEATRDGPGAQGATQAGVTTPEEIDVNATNVTGIEWVLTWTDDVGNPDEFNLTVTSPSGENRSIQGTNGRLSVVFEGIAPMPGEMRILAASQAEAEGRIARDATTRGAEGTWGVAIRLVRAPGVVSPTSGVEVPPDGQNAWTLASTLTVYEPRIVQG